jgi:putative phosphoribosyl transferase
LFELFPPLSLPQSILRTAARRLLNASAKAGHIDEVDKLATRSSLPIEPVQGTPNIRGNIMGIGLDARPIATPEAQSTAEVRMAADDATLEGAVTVPGNASKLVLFAHGSGSSRHSPRNRFVAQKLNDTGLATLLFDLLTREEEAVDLRTARYRFDIGLLAQRLLHATQWARQYKRTRHLRFGYFGASTGGSAAIVAAAELPGEVGAVVSRGGRPDLAGDALPRVRVPTLLIVGGKDDVVIGLNEQARERMRGEVKLQIIPGATHLFQEPGALQRVADLAADWFLTKLG